jgi:rod shape determining protein RodA
MLYIHFIPKHGKTREMSRYDLTFPIIVGLLLLTGLITLSTAAPEWNFTIKQSVFMAVGLVGAGVVLWLGRSRIMQVAWPLYWVSIGLLVLTHLFGREVNGAKSWLYIGPLPGFQPSELAKIALILTLAKVLHEKPIKSLLGYFRPGIIILVPFALVFLEPDLGSSLVLAAIGGAMLLVRGIPWKHLLLFSLVLVLAFPTVVWPNLKPHQKTRLTIFLNPSADPKGSGYQVIQSRIAIGSGGVWGKGYKQGTQSQLGFIPYRYSDFIFPVLAEEGGFVASVSLLLLYALLFWRLTILSLECPYERDQLAIAGVLCLIAFQVIVNIGVTLGLAPVTGITLPLVSYGGTSLLSTLVALGLVFVIHRDRYKDW